MRDAQPQFARRNAQLLIILAQEPGHIRQAAAGLTIPGGQALRAVKPGDPLCPVLADSAATVSASYGLAFQEFCATGNRPATFVIDQAGVIRWEYRAKENAADRPAADDVLAAIDALKTKQHVD